MDDPGLTALRPYAAAEQREMLEETFVRLASAAGAAGEERLPSDARSGIG